MNATSIGSQKHELDTPLLCIDLDQLQRNIEVMSDQCRQHGVHWRPHCKCHKSSRIARQQVEHGALGVTCAKLGEAEIMAAGGVRDILIANMIVGPLKLQRLAKIAEIADPIVCVDDLQQARATSETLSAAGQEVRVILEVDIGLHRVGVLPGKPLLELAAQVKTLPGVKLAGIMGYEGHLLTVQDQEEKRQQIHQALDTLVDCAEALRESGIECEIVSCGGTGSFFISTTHPGITEVQAGGGIFMDAFYRNKCQIHELDYAVTVTASIVSRPAADRAIIDAGRKTLNKEQHMPLVANQPGATVEMLSAEHGRLQLEGAAQQLKIGDRIELLPGYVDFTTMLHDYFHCFRGTRLEAVWPVEARGKVT